MCIYIYIYDRSEETPTSRSEHIEKRASLAFVRKTTIPLPRCAPPWFERLQTREIESGPYVAILHYNLLHCNMIYVYNIQ